MEALNLSLPFYGKAGTISRIVTNLEEKCYFKFEYDANGNEKSMKPISSRKVNGLKDNYYLDVLGYLSANQSKVKTYQSSRLKKKINLKNLYIDAIVSGVLATIGLGLSVISFQMAPAGWVTAISILIFATSSTYCGLKIRDKIIYNKDLKKSKYISYYQSLQRDLNDYHFKKSIQHTPTSYQGLVSENSKENTIKKTKILEK